MYPLLMTIEPIGGAWGTSAFKMCIRLRKIEIGMKFKNLGHQRLRNHASDAKHFFGFLSPRKPEFRGAEDAGRRALGGDSRDPGRIFWNFQDSGRIPKGESRIFKVLEGFPKVLEPQAMVSNGFY